MNAYVVFGGLCGVVTLAAFTAMLIWRVVEGDINRDLVRRFILVDLLLWVAACEMLLDLAIEVTGDPGGGFLFGVMITRGMIGTGALALLVTFPRREPRPQKERRVSDRRRTPSSGAAQ